MSLHCKTCGKRSYSEYCVQHKPRKAIKQKGKRTLEYEKWRDTIAKPILDEYYGHVCSHPFCGETKDLDIDHKQNRGSHPELKMDITNVQYLCRYHHSLKTDRKEN